MRVDVNGNLWCAWSGGEAEDGVVVFAPDGKMIGRIMLPERCANLCFGGTKRNRLWRANRSIRCTSRRKECLAVEHLPSRQLRYWCIACGFLESD